MFMMTFLLGDPDESGDYDDDDDLSDEDGIY